MSQKRCYPLSLAQEKLWLFEQIHTKTAAYHIPVLFRLRGEVDVQALRLSIKEVVRRQQSLRATFRLENGVPVQSISANSNVLLKVEDLSGDNHKKLQQRIGQEIDALFDLTRGPLVHIHLFRLAPADHMLLIVAHHIVVDGWSMGILCRELSELYSARIEKRDSQLPKLATSFSTFVRKQRQGLTEEVLAARLDFWREQLAGVPFALDLPTDHPRPAVPTHRGALERLALSSYLAKAVKSLARRLRATPFMVLLAAFQTLLARYTGQSDVVVSSPMAGRTRAGSERLIGEFANTVPLRADLSADPDFETLVAQMRHRVLMTYTHQELPLNELVLELKLPRSLSYSPYGQVIFALQNTPKGALNFSGLSVEEMDPEWSTARVDLSLALDDSGDGFLGTLEYSTELFEAPTMRRFIGHFVTLLEAIVAAPDKRLSEYPILTPAEQQELAAWSRTEKSYVREQCAHGLLERQARRTPEAVAIIAGDKQWSYRELDNRANQFANLLCSYGISIEDRVAVDLERSFDWIAIVFGIMKAGGVYVPIDPKLPPSRAAHIVQDARAKLVIKESMITREGWPADTCLLDLKSGLVTANQSAVTPPQVKVSPQNLVYIIYTSGSTGRPKGVAIEHHCLAHLHNTQEWFGVGPSDRVLQFSSLSFDASIFEIILALTAGAALVLRPPQPIVGPLLTDFLESQKISVTILSPGVLASAPARPLPALKTLMIGGEAGSADVYARWSPGHCFWNLYGPTEGTVWVTASDAASAADPGNIGVPTANSQTYVVDAALQPLPLGVPGELYISGDGLARGYWNQPTLTAAAFLPNPFSPEPGARMYRTGDRVRRRADGSMEFLGRLDHQIKLLGVRIELGEIENVLQEHPDVRVCAVIRDRAEPERLIAFVVGRQGIRSLDESILRNHLKKRLPDYMVPAVFATLDSLPLGSTGKIDRQALAEIKLSKPAVSPLIVKYGKSNEEVIAGAWKSLLGRNDVRLDENFFEAGGNSLLIVRLHNTLQSVFGPTLNIAALFQYPTIASLAAHLSDRDKPTKPQSSAPTDDVQFSNGAPGLLHQLRARQI